MGQHYTICSCACAGKPTVAYLTLCRHTSIVGSGQTTKSTRCMQMPPSSPDVCSGTPLQQTLANPCVSFLFPCRLKVHYRAAPGARGSGVERGHGQELPHCPLCLAKLDDVKYHKCAAGLAAQANPVSYKQLIHFGPTLLRYRHSQSLPSLLRHLRCEVGSYYPKVTACFVWLPG